jgi:TonB family protein
MLQHSPTARLARPQGSFTNRQPLQLQIALLLLLVALGVVLAKDRDFWFGPDQTADSQATGSESTAKLNSTAAAPAKNAPAPVSRIEAARIELAKIETAKIEAAKTEAAKTQAAKMHAAQKTAANTVTGPAQDTSSQDSPVVTRAALPPLDFEVVAGDAHRTVRPGSSITKVEIPGDSNRASAAAASAPSVSTNAAQRELLPAGAAPELRQTLDAAYPLLGQHTRVQGSVVLQAIVGTDGIIQDLRVLSGPSILTAAAQQAVRQWRFKPYLQNGQPVETKARIVVNFSIRVADNPETT